MEEKNDFYLLLQTQQKMSEDIAEIRATVKEAAQIIVFVRRDQDEIKIKYDRLEKLCLECPARKKMEGWGISLKDFFWLLTFVAALFSAWYSITNAK